MTTLIIEKGAFKVSLVLPFKDSLTRAFTLETARKGSDARRCLEVEQEKIFGVAVPKITKATLRNATGEAVTLLAVNLVTRNNTLSAVFYGSLLFGIWYDMLMNSIVSDAVPESLCT